MTISELKKIIREELFKEINPSLIRVTKLDDANEVKKIKINILDYINNLKMPKRAELRPELFKINIMDKRGVGMFEKAVKELVDDEAIFHFVGSEYGNTNKTPTALNALKK